MSYLTEEERKEIEESGCPHIGKLPPEHFQCGDCEDNARDCNCFDCMIVFCDECNTMFPFGCEVVRQAWEEHRRNKNES